MKVIYKDSEIQREQNYPNSDISTNVIGKNEDIQFYFIEEITIENPKPDRFNLIQQPDILTDEIHSEYKHLKICKRNWTLEEKTEQAIIDKLNNELGSYLDAEYPIWERNKHLQEFLFEQTPERIRYIQQLSGWLTECRNIRQERENLYLENHDNFPEFGNYPQRP